MTQPTGRISFNKGRKVSFDINTFDKLQNGMVYLDYTEIRVDFEDIDTNKGWNLTVQAEAGYTDITPYFTGTGLPLDIIAIEADCPACNHIIIPVPSAVTLKTTAEYLAFDEWSGGTGVLKNVTKTVSLSYYCNKGVAGGTIIDFGDYTNDTYVVELYFTLQRIP